MKDTYNIKFLRALFTREDQPDQYQTPATAKECVVPATFLLTKLDPADPASAAQVHSFWFGTVSGGHARLAEVTMITANEYQRIINRIAHVMVECGAARDLPAAFDLAQFEVEHTQKLADRDVGTVLVIERVMTKHGISDTFKTVPRE